MGAAIGIGIYLHNFLSSDPLARYRLGEIAPDQQEIAITLKDVDFKQYQGEQMISNALIKKLEISKNRKNFRFTDIVDGTYYAKENLFHFSAKEGVWNPDTQKLYASRDIHLYNKDLNLHSSEFEYDEPTDTLTIPTYLRGKLFEGDVEAYRLVYRTNLTHIFYHEGRPHATIVPSILPNFIHREDAFSCRNTESFMFAHSQ